MRTTSTMKKITNTFVVSAAGGIVGMIGVGTVWIATAGLPGHVRFALGALVAVAIGWWIGGIGLHLLPHPAPPEHDDDDGKVGSTVTLQ